MSKINKIEKYQNEINSKRPFSENLLKQIKEYYKIGLRRLAKINFQIIRK